MMRPDADKSTVYSRYMKACGVTRDKNNKTIMSCYGWGLSHSHKYLDANSWSEWWPPGTFLEAGFDYNNATVPLFFRTRKIAKKYKSLHTDKNSRYRIARYKITWKEL